MITSELTQYVSMYNQSTLTYRHTEVCQQRLQPASENLNSICVSDLHLLLTVQCSRKTLPIKIPSCPSTHHCKISHPTDFNGVFCSLHEHPRAEFAVV